MTDFSDLLKQRRSIRDFQEKEVSIEIVKEILKDTCLAPSSGNGQPWRFIIVNDRNLIKRLSDESKSNMLADVEKNSDSPLKKYETALQNENFNVFYNAPCLVFIVGRKDSGSLLVNCTLAACYFMLSASAKGLGTCWVGLGSSLRNKDILDEIGIAEGYSIVAPIILGYPKDIPGIPDRNEPQILKIIS